MQNDATLMMPAIPTAGAGQMESMRVVTSLPRRKRSCSAGTPRWKMRAGILFDQDTGPEEQATPRRYLQSWLTSILMD